MKPSSDWGVRFFLRFVLACLILPVLFFLSCIFWTFLTSSICAIDPSLRWEIKGGMTKAEVEAILGPPSSPTTRTDNLWWYSVRGEPHVRFQIVFDKQGTVNNVHDFKDTDLVWR